MQRRELLKGAAAGVVAGALPNASTAAPAAGTAARVLGPTKPADMILTGGKVITVDPPFSIVDSVAIAGDRILAVGPRAAMARHTAPGTRTVELKGKAVIPGLIDTHAHMDLEVLSKSAPSLAGVRSIRDLQDRIREIARAKQPGEWIVTMPLGDPPDYLGAPGILTEKRWPTRQELDAAAPDNPVLIRPMSGYLRGPPMTAAVNTLALRKVGIGRDTVAPAQIVIARDANGDPTGVITDTALPPALEHRWFTDPTTPTLAERIAAVPISQARYHAYGTTGIYEGHGLPPLGIRAYKQAHARGVLDMRARLILAPDWGVIGDAPVGPFLEAWGGAAGQPDLGDDMLKVVGLYASIGNPAAEGLPRARVKEILLACARADIRPSLNFGRSGIIDLLDEVDREIPLKGRRWVVTHFNVIPPKDIERIVRMGLVLTSHLNEMVIRDGAVWQGRLPREQWRDNTPMRSLMAAGVHVGLVSDNNPISLWRPLWGAVARRSGSTNEQFSPEEALTRQQALRCATMNGAYVTFEEDSRGSIEPGKLADLAVLDADPLTVAEPKLRDIKALTTIVGGKVVHQAGAA